MKRALAAALLLSACVNEPAPAPAPDPFAYEHEQPTTVTFIHERDESGVRPPDVTQTIPTEITARCRDGWISYSPERRGTCSGHGGVRQWVNRPAE